jgi:hypothetical protein
MDPAFPSLRIPGKCSLGVPDGTVFLEDDAAMEKAQKDEEKGGK